MLRQMPQAIVSSRRNCNNNILSLNSNKYQLRIEIFNDYLMAYAGCIECKPIATPTMIGLPSWVYPVNQRCGCIVRK